MCRSRRIWLALFLSGIVFSCQDSSAPTSLQDNTGAEHFVTSVLWYQRSAEMRACYYQTFNMARLLLDSHLQNADQHRPKAVIVDIDETILDNSPYQAWLALSGSVFGLDSWKRWTSLSRADPLPGAVEFLTYARSKGVTVFYITNRGTDERDSTLKNLQKHDFPFAVPSHLLLRTGADTDKTARRNLVEKEYEVLLLIGDSLTDFDAVFADRGQNFGFEAVDDHRHLFGDRFLILPNPMYGTWESSLHNAAVDVSPGQQADKRRRALKSYR